MSGGSERKQFFMILVVCLVGFFILSVVGVLKFSLAPGLRSSYAGADGASAPATAATAPRLTTKVSTKTPRASSVFRLQGSAFR